MIIGNRKGVNNRDIRLGSITSSGKGSNGHCTYMASHRKCIVKYLNKKIFSRSSCTTNEPNFKIVCNCIHELLNFFEDSAQHEHAIAFVTCIMVPSLYVFKLSIYKYRKVLSG